MDRGLFFNSNIEIEVDESDTIEPQFVNVETLKEEDEDAIDITEHPLVIEREVNFSDDNQIETLYNDNLRSMRHFKNIEESTTGKESASVELKDDSQSSSISDVQSVFIIKDYQESSVNKHRSAKKNLHSAPKKNPKCYSGGAKLKKISSLGMLNESVSKKTTVLTQKITPPDSSSYCIKGGRSIGPSLHKSLLNNITNQNSQINVTKENTPTTSRVQSNIDSQVVKGMTNVPIQTSVAKVLAVSCQESPLEVDNTRSNPCIIPGCKIYKNEQVYAFKVPENTLLLNMWDLCIDMKEAKILVFNDVICYKHFDKSDVVHNFKINKIDGAEVLVDEPHLRKGAMPCIQYLSECCIIGCKKTTGNMFTFPVLNNNNLHLWLYMVKNLNLKRLSVKELLKHRVCELHFEKDCFDELGELNDYAVPTLFLPVNVDPKSFEGMEQPVEYLDLNPSLCIIRNCESKAKQTGLSNLISLPCKDFAGIKVWLQACDRTELMDESFFITLKNIYGFGICDKHFLPQDFENVSMSRLKPDASPRKDLARNLRKACAFKLCYNSANQIKKIYSFPGDFERTRSWLHIMKREDLKVSALKNKQILDGYGVCEDHFLESDFVDGELSMTAIPKNVIKFRESNLRVSYAFPENREKLSFTSQHKERVPTTSTLRTLKVRPVKILPNTCFYRGCKSTPSASNPFIDFPLEKSRYRTWLRACGYRNDGSVSIPYQICCQHFGKSAYDADAQLVNGLVTPVPYKGSRFVDPPEYVTKNITSNFVCTDQRLTENVSNLPEDASEKETHKYLNSKAVPVNEKRVEDLNSQKGVPLDEMDLEMLCAVENCISLYKGYEATAHKFPNPHKETERFEMWLRLVANESLDPLSSEEIYRSYVVCKRHFEPYFYLKRTVRDELLKVAIPTLNLVKSCDWLKESVFYQKQLLPHLEELNINVPQVVTTWLGSEPMKFSNQEDKRRCILEKDRLRFPGIGCFLRIDPRNNHTRNRKFPYKVYKCNKSGVSPVTPEYGDNFRVHTAIVIDDDDECEKTVMQYLGRKRKAASNMFEND